jgi:hypothetical protein
MQAIISDDFSYDLLLKYLAKAIGDTFPPAKAQEELDKQITGLLLRLTAVEQREFRKLFTKERYARPKSA